MLSPPITDFLRGLKMHDMARMAADQSEEKIRVHGVTSRLGGFYERMRYFVDQKEEHTIRRSAIERMLKRTLIFEQRKEIGHALVQELVSAGYLPNNSIAERAAGEVQKIADVYAALDTEVRTRTSERSIRAPVIGLAASEIEQLWYPAPVDELIAKAFYESVRPHVICDASCSDEELNAHVYIACRRTLLRNDDQAIRYAFWCDVRDEETGGSSLADCYIAFAERMHTQLNHPVSTLLAAKLRNYAICFALIKEIAGTHGMAAERIMGDPQLLRPELERLLKPKYRETNQRARRSGLRAVVYVVCTKILLALGGELPYELFVLHAANYTALGINVAFHPLLLFLMTATITSLGDQNTRLIFDMTREVLFEEKRQLIRIKTKKPAGALRVCFALLYGALVCATFGGIVWGLYALHFSIISTALFLFFLTLVSYLGLRVRYTAQKWRVWRNEDEGGLSLLWGALTLPIIRVGQWMSKTFSSVNILVFIMDFILETPFKLLLGVFDAFLSFLKEKKEETYE